MQKQIQYAKTSQNILERLTAATGDKPITSDVSIQAINLNERASDNNPMHLSRSDTFGTTLHELTHVYTRANQRVMDDIEHFITKHKVGETQVWDPNFTAMRIDLDVPIPHNYTTVYFKENYDRTGSKFTHEFLTMFATDITRMDNDDDYSTESAHGLGNLAKKYPEYYKTCIEILTGRYKRD